MRLRFYRVDEDYTDELRKINPKGVTINQSGHVNTYVGILFIINGYKYIAPLTHTTLVNKWHQQPIRIINNLGQNTNNLGTILFHNMIPVYDEVYTEVDLDSYREVDIRRYNLYAEQLIWMNETQNKKTIIEKAELTYNVHLDENHPDHYFLNNVLYCNFSGLENKMSEIIQNDR